jgi:hypothetical protein
LHQLSLTTTYSKVIMGKQTNRSLQYQKDWVCEGWSFDPPHITLQFQNVNNAEIGAWSIRVLVNNIEGLTPDPRYNALSNLNMLSLLKVAQGAAPATITEKSIDGSPEWKSVTRSWNSPEGSEGLKSLNQLVRKIKVYSQNESRALGKIVQKSLKEHEINI